MVLTRCWLVVFCVLLHGAKVVPVEPGEWHGWGKIKHPQTFIGPAAAAAGTSTIASVVMPPPASGGWAGVGFGGQATTGSSRMPGAGVLAVWANGTWVCGSATGAVAPASWYNLSVTLFQGQARSWSLYINGKLVDVGSNCSGAGVAVGADAGSPPAASGAGNFFGFLAASYHGSAAAAEFRSVGLAVTAAAAPAPPPPPSPGPPSPPNPGPPSPGPPSPPVPPGVLEVERCAAGDPQQLFVFSGEVSIGHVYVSERAVLSTCTPRRRPRSPTRLNGGDAGLVYVARAHHPPPRGPSVWVR